MRTLGMASAFVIAACFDPHYSDCEVRCEATSNACPLGLTCDLPSKMCRHENAAACPFDPNACWDDAGGMSPTNFLPCDGTWPTATPSFTTQAGFGVLLCTDDGTFGPTGSTCPAPGGTVGEMYVIPSHPPVWLVHATTVSLAGPLIIRGSLPLLVVSENPIVIASTAMIVDAHAGALESALPATTACDAKQGATDSTTGFASGGGGGGYAGGGGSGSPSRQTGIDGGAGGSAIAPALLSPLAFGCPGRSGGGGNDGTFMVMGGLGGNGGGAIELVSQVSIELQASVLITAGGAGGHGGTRGAVGAVYGGGGGGGAGGAILLEAPTLVLHGMIGAAGAGGGAGADTIQASGTAAQTGGDGGLGAGSGGSNGATTGGSGSMDEAIPGMAAMTTSTTASGAGGGGASGRIRLHANTIDATGAQIVPTPIEQ